MSGFSTLKMRAILLSISIQLHPCYRTFLLCCLKWDVTKVVQVTDMKLSSAGEQ
jgi:hypothetical protein